LSEDGNADLLDCLDVAEVRIAVAKQLVKRLIISNKNATATAWRPEKIKWEPAEGASGLYDRSEDVNSLDFKAMVKDLVTHQGKLHRDGFFFWLFRNGYTVGRKPRKKQEPQP